ncbi:MAG: MAPEG family protein [Gammaproteobacteria bacterium]|nr:MAPEG family protein [Pseudomonadales bacterium]MCP5349224.1 MAPEG family protein [Pseudomonadales bacterium]
MSAELHALTLVTILTALIWIPYILNLILVRGLINAVGYPENPAPLAPWASRMKSAHANAIENLVIFATLVLVVEIAGLNNATTALACTVYFWARVVHLAVYTLAIPWARTLAFVVGFLCQATLAVQILF